MKVKSYIVLERAVDEGIKLGWNRAHKHTDKPSEDHIKETISTAVMATIEEVFSFEDGEIIE